MDDGDGIHFASKCLRAPGNADSRPGGYSTHCRSGGIHHGRRDTGLRANGNAYPSHRDSQPDSTTFQYTAAVAYLRDARVDSNRRTHILYPAGGSNASSTNIQLG